MEQFSHSPEYKLQVTNRTCVDIAEKVGHLSQYWGGSLYGPAYSQNYWGGSSLAAHRKFTPMDVKTTITTVKLRIVNQTPVCMRDLVVTGARLLSVQVNQAPGLYAGPGL